MTNKYSTGDISAHLGITLTVDFVTHTLDVPYIDKDKRACLYDDQGYEAICDALMARITNLRDELPDKKPKVKKEPKAKSSTSSDAQNFDDEEEL